MQTGSNAQLLILVYPKTLRRKCHLKQQRVQIIGTTTTLDQSLYKIMASKFFSLGDRDVQVLFCKNSLYPLNDNLNILSDQSLRVLGLQKLTVTIYCICGDTI